MRSPLPFPCVPDRPYKILLELVQVWGPCPSPTPRLACPFYLFIYYPRRAGRADAQQITEFQTRKTKKALQIHSFTQNLPRYALPRPKRARRGSDALHMVAALLQDEQRQPRFVQHAAHRAKVFGLQREARFLSRRFGALGVQSLASHPGPGAKKRTQRAG